MEKLEVHDSLDGAADPLLSAPLARGCSDDCFEGATEGGLI